MTLSRYLQIMDSLKCVQLLCKADASGVPVLLRMTGEGVHNSAAACGEAAGRASVPGRPRHQGLFTPSVPTTATFLPIRVLIIHCLRVRADKIGSLYRDLV